MVHNGANFSTIFKLSCNFFSTVYGSAWRFDLRRSSIWRDSMSLLTVGNRNTILLVLSIKWLGLIIVPWGRPSAWLIVSDRTSLNLALNSQELRKFCKDFNILLVFSRTVQVLQKTMSHVKSYAFPCQKPQIRHVLCLFELS